MNFKGIETKLELFSRVLKALAYKENEIEAIFEKITTSELLEYVVEDLLNESRFDNYYQDITFTKVYFDKSGEVIAIFTSSETDHETTYLFNLNTAKNGDIYRQLRDEMLADEKAKEYELKCEQAEANENARYFNRFF